MAYPREPVNGPNLRSGSVLSQHESESICRGDMPGGAISRVSRSLLAFGGAALDGHKLMRFVFIDEGGISHHEPSAIVCGVVVHADEKLIPLEEALDEIIQKHIPEQYRENFVLHAADIWAGNRIFRDREQWPWEKRSAILQEIVELPKRLNLPIVHGWFLKEKIVIPQIAKNFSRKDKGIMEHVLCFVHCVVNANILMLNGFQNEVAQIVAEDNSEARKLIKAAMRFIQNPTELDDQMASLLPIVKIRNPVLFADKKESKALQLADACAFFIRRRLEKNDPRSRPFYEHLLPMIFEVPPLDAALIGQWPFGPSLFMRGPNNLRR